MQGTRPSPRSGRTPHVEEQLSLCATTAKPMLWSPYCNYWGPHALGPMLCNKGICVLSRVRFFATPWAAAHQSSLSMEFSRQEYQGGLPFPTPGDLPDPGIKPASLASPVLAGTFFTTALPGRPLQWGVCRPQLESSLHLSQLERAQGQQQRPSTAKNGRWEIRTELTRIWAEWHDYLKEICMTCCGGIKKGGDLRISASFMEEVPPEEWIYLSVTDSFAVLKKIAQHCKSTIIQ